MMTSGAMYIGEPHKVAAITPSCRKRANPKSAIFIVIEAGDGFRDEPVGIGGEGAICGNGWLNSKPVRDQLEIKRISGHPLTALTLVF